MCSVITFVQYILPSKSIARPVTCTLVLCTFTRFKFMEKFTVIAVFLNSFNEFYLYFIRMVYRLPLSGFK